MFEDYKYAHEAFVSNNNGDTIWSVLGFLSHIPLLCMLCLQLSTTLVGELILLALPTLLLLTACAYQYKISLCFLTVLAFAAFARKDTNFSCKNLKFLSWFKGINVLVTCIAILAVDFPIFPRKFGKTEKFGISIMDLGVGSFMISTAVTSRYARSGIIDTGWKPRAQRLSVLLLGCVRMVVLKLANYHEHVSEYGVHWNFFVTLYAGWTLADLLKWGNPLVEFCMALSMLCGYQYALATTDLTDFMMSEDRKDLFSANKEGIVSLLGYVPLYVISELVSQRLFFPRSSSSEVQSEEEEELAGKDTEERNTVPKGLVTVVVSCWLAWVVSEHCIQTTSRRLVNCAFVSLSLATSFSIILSFYLLERRVSAERTIHTLELMNKHSLWVFLAANLLTGLVNSAMQTIYASTATSLAVLSGYVATVVAIAWTMPVLMKFISGTCR